MDRPRRSTRVPSKAPQLTVAPKPAARVAKRRPTPEPIPPEVQLKTLLESSKSDLVSREMSEIININTWTLLPPEAQAKLKALLPPTAFFGYQETIGKDHPSVEAEGEDESSEMAVDEDLSSRELNPAFFTDPHFLAACRTFQDHLYLNWFSEAHVQKVAKFQQGIVDGTLAAPWKDEVWERDNPPPPPPPPQSQAPVIPATSSFVLAGGSTEVKLPTLVKNKILRVGDVLAYRRVFAASGVTVEKDCIIDFVHPKTYALDIRMLPGTTRDLPVDLLKTSGSSSSSHPSSSSAFVPTITSSTSASASTSSTSTSSTTPTPIQTTTITGPSMLETALLDLDGRIDKSRRPNGNSWKMFTVWRWRDAGAGYQPYDSRGGRENHGTLFYLRSCFWHDS